MGFLQKFHLVVRYKKDIYNNISAMLSMPIISASNLLKHNYVLHEIYVEQYAFDNEFQDVYENLSQGNQVEELDYHVHNNLLYDLCRLCIL